MCHRAAHAARESDPTPVAREVSTPTPLAAAVAASTVLAATEDVPSGPVHLAPAYKIAARSLLAIGVLVLFYGFALAMAAALALGAFLLIAGGFLYGIIVVFLAIAIPLSLIPRFSSFEPPSRATDPKKAPHLFATVRAVARATRQRMPRCIYLVPGTNAGVLDAGLFDGRVLFLGIDLLQKVTIGELHAILGHEFGHFASGDTGLGTWVYQASRQIARTERASLAYVDFVGEVFGIWTEVFQQIAMPICRQQELRADALGARVAGVDAMRRALRAISGGSEVLAPVAGWSDDSGATHPPLRERLALLDGLPDVRPLLPDDPRPAITLLQPADTTRPQTLEGTHLARL